MSRSKLRWATTSVPSLRHQLAQNVRAESGRLEDMRQRALAGGLPHFASDFQRSSLEWASLADALTDAGMFWVTDPMARVAMDAASDVPVLTMEHCPAPAGMMVFAEPLPGFDTSSIGGLALRDGIRTDIPYRDPVPVDALVWHREGPALLDVHLMCRAKRLPLPLTPNDGELTPFIRSSVIVPGDLTTPPEGKTHSWAMFSFLAAAWHLMAMPTLAEQRDIDAEWGTPATPTTRPARRVTTIDLRPLRHVTTEPETNDTPKRRLIVRHYVRGHWRNQPCGPALSKRRLVYIEPYIKGPAEAPLHNSEKVMIWRR